MKRNRILIQTVNRAMRVADVGTGKAALALGVHPGTIWRKKTGRTGWTRSELIVIANLCGVTLEYLLGGADVP